MLVTYSSQVKKALIIITFINLNALLSSGESCQFHWNNVNRGSGPGLSSAGSGSRYRLPYKDKKECPCFHTDNGSDNSEACPYTSDAFNPLIDCAYLPREFIECAEPVDHAGNQTAREKLGYGCLKVCQTFN